jgi:hypothetical protein
MALINYLAEFRCNETAGEWCFFLSVPIYLKKEKTLRSSFYHPPVTSNIVLISHSPLLFTKEKASIL